MKFIMKSYSMKTHFPLRNLKLPVFFVSGISLMIKLLFAACVEFISFGKGIGKIVLPVSAQHRFQPKFHYQLFVRFRHRKP